jgi:CDGSH-type Zn-finger protein/uncharacterized Fe-S cluster protein YjdI
MNGEGATSDARDTGSIEPRPAAIGEPARGVARGDRVHAFAAPGITVTWSRTRCTHAADCVMNLPTVFEPGRRPWVDATQASADAVARVVARCPTGALHFERQDGGASEPVPTANTVLLARNGPVMLRGDIEVLDDTGAVLLRDTRVALCRCGLSLKKPLCDDTHAEVGFRDPGMVTGEDAVSDPGATGGTLRVLPHADGPLELSGPFALSSADKKTMLAGSRTSLCRCGKSQTKPFCDRSHERVGFRSG